MCNFVNFFMAVEYFGKRLTQAYNSPITRGTPLSVDFWNFTEAVTPRQILSACAITTLILVQIGNTSIASGIHEIIS